MGWLILTIIICIVFGIVVYHLEFGDIADFIMGGFLGLVFSAIFIGLSFLGANREIIRVEEVVQYNIQGLENKNDSESYVTGMFILGCGGILGETSSDIYYYFFKVDDNGKKLEKINGTDVYIRETNEHEPCYIVKKEIIKYTGFYNWLFGDGEHMQQTAKILVVPENTIKIDYNIDI